MVCITGAFPLGRDEDDEIPIGSVESILSHRGPAKMMRVDGPHDRTAVIALQMLQDHRGEVRESTSGFWIADGWDTMEGSLKILREGLDPSQVHDRSVQGLSLHLADIGDLLVLKFDSLGLNILRSRLSFKPIHYQLQGNNILFSTERKALWSLGVAEPVTIQPGQFLNVTWEGEISLAWRIPDLQPPVDHSREPVVYKGQLRRELTQSFNKITGSEVGVLFSGGVDSSLVAFLAKKRFSRVTLYTACASEARDHNAAQEAAEVLECPITFIEMNEELIWKTLPEVVYAIERANRMDIEIATPFLLASKQARKDGLKLIISGQGPDELFAGYSRYVNIFRRAGEKALEQRLWKDISSTHDKNIERDELAVAFGGCDLFCPYLSSSFIQLAMQIPASYKVHPDDPPERKVIFRELAAEMGLDPMLANREKKATQYSSGSAKLLTESMRCNVAELAHSTKREVYQSIDLVLSEIAAQIGMLGHPIGHDTNLTINLRAVHDFKKRL